MNSGLTSLSANALAQIHSSHLWHTLSDSFASAVMSLHRCALRTPRQPCMSSCAWACMFRPSRTGAPSFELEMHACYQTRYFIGRNAGLRCLCHLDDVSGVHACICSTAHDMMLHVRSQLVVGHGSLRTVSADHDVVQDGICASNLLGQIRACGSNLSQPDSRVADVFLIMFFCYP